MSSNGAVERLGGAKLAADVVTSSRMRSLDLEAREIDGERGELSAMADVGRPSDFSRQASERPAGSSDTEWSNLAAKVVSATSLSQLEAASAAADKAEREREVVRVECLGASESDVGRLANAEERPRTSTGSVRSEPPLPSVD